MHAPRSRPRGKPLQLAEPGGGMGRQGWRGWRRGRPVEGRPLTGHCRANTAHRHARSAGVMLPPWRVCAGPRRDFPRPLPPASTRVPPRACPSPLSRRPLLRRLPPPPVPPLSAHRWTSSSVPWPLSLRRAPPSAPCARVKTAALGAAPSLPGVRFAAGWYVCSRITITHHRWPTRTLSAAGHRAARGRREWGMTVRGFVRA